MLIYTPQHELQTIVCPYLKINFTKTALGEEKEVVPLAIPGEGKGKKIVSASKYGA